MVHSPFRTVVLAVALVTLAGCTSDPTRPESDTPQRRDPVDRVGTGRSEPAEPFYADFGNPEIDVLRYDLRLTWSPGERSLTATATLDIRIARPTAVIPLDFDGGLVVDNVALGGNLVDATQRADDLIVPAGATLDAGTKVKLSVRYHGNPQPADAPMVRAPSLGLFTSPDGAAWAIQEPYGAFTWFPANDIPSDEAHYDTAITVPRGWAGVSSGAFLGSSRNDNGTATYRWRTVHPVATYALAFAVGRYELHTDTMADGLRIRYWTTAEGGAAALRRARRSPALISWLEQRFGPYPFAYAGVVDIPARQGLETQTMITLNLGAPVEVLLHEYAHEWFGNSVTPRTWQDLWLSEGFATYVQMMYEVDKLGASAAEAVAHWRAVDGQLRAKHGPPGHPKPGHFASRNVYYCAALMLHELRGELGDERFFDMMRAWAQQHSGSHQDRQSFTSWLNGYTGRDLTALVNRWLDSPTTPA